MGKKRTGQRIGISVKMEDLHTWRATLRIDGKEAGTFYGNDQLETLRTIAKHLVAMEVAAEESQEVPA